jgi:hypothetical protein
MKKMFAVVTLGFTIIASGCGIAEDTGPVQVDNINNKLPESSEILGHSIYRGDFETWTIESEGCKFIIVQDDFSNDNIAISPIGQCESGGK